MKDSGKRKSALVREVQQLRKQVQALREGEHVARRAERALAQYWSLLDAIMSGPNTLFALKGTDYLYQAGSKAFCRLVGRPEAEIRGLGDYDLFPNQIADIFHRDDVRVIQASVPSQYETEVGIRERSYWLHIQKRPMLRQDGRCIGVLMAIADISELGRIRGQRRILAQSGGNGYWCTDTHGLILDVNHAYCALTGYSPEELVGKHIHDIEIVKTPEALSQINDHIMRDGMGSYRTLHRSKSSRILEFEVDAVYIPEHGGRFFRYFQPSPTDADRSRNSSSPGAIAPAYPPAPISHRKVLNLNQLVLLAIEQEVDQIPPGISIRKYLESDLKNTLVNQSQILQVIINITTNAVEAMEGRGHLTFTTRNVELTSEWLQENPKAQPGPFVYLAISDTGRGIAPNLANKIFDPFITTKFKGRGMGLASVSRNVSEHHGIVTVKTEVGKGSTFGVYLPATEAPVELGIRSPQIPAGTETILIVDPESRVLEEGRRILESLAYTVLLTTTLESAVARVESADPAVDLLVVDTAASMAYKSDFLEALRLANPRVKVILAGSHEWDAWSQDLLDAGANGFVKKPFRAGVLAPKIRQTLDSG